MIRQIGKEIDMSFVRQIHILLPCTLYEYDHDITEIIKQYIVLDTHSRCPQGGVLSLLRWCLVLYRLLGLNESWIYTQAYVDDLVILTSGKSPGVISNLTQRALDILVS